MSQKPPKVLAAEVAARTLEKALASASAASPGASAGTGPFTVADAATKSGLPLDDAERGLTHLVHEYRGHLRVSDDGDLLHLFPTGFTKPWETRDAITSALAALMKGVSGAARFLVRAWLTIAILGYVGIFLALLIGLTLARQGNDRDGIPFGSILGAVFRVLADALFWTFHPFSPLAIDPYYGGRTFRPTPVAERDKVPFYEKVNRFVFGPTPPEEDALATERLILAEIRAGKGRIGVADVMRVTGLSRFEADQRMARLMLDYDGDVHVTDSGAIVYRFAAIRKTAESTTPPRPATPAWTRAKELAPLTGNGTGTNILVAALNGFNLLMATFALSTNLTLARVANLFMIARHPDLDIAPLGYDGVPLVLGLVPLVFSLVLFALPIGRAILRPQQERAVAKEKGRLAVLREALAHAKNRTTAAEDALRAAYARAAGHAPSDADLTAAVVSFGGDVDLDAAEHPKTRVAPGVEGSPVKYRFVDLEAEAEALEDERALAPEAEAKVAPIVFSSEH